MAKRAASSPAPRPAGPRRAAGGRPPATDATPRGKRRRVDYPRAGRSGIARFIPSLRQVLGLIVLSPVAAVLLFAFAYLTIQVPSPNQFGSAETTIVYFADGQTEMGKFAATNRTVVTNDEIPQSMKDAVVAAEDRSFYENRGISPKGIARAFWQNIRGESTQGGSTITQQYVKNYYLDADRTYTRKLKEAVISIKIDQQQSKDEILTNYLNTIYFGRGTYGIQTAAQAYFNKDAKDLTPQEAALLAGIIPNPTNWDPAVNPAKAQQRFDYVADELVRTGKATQAERDSWQLPAAPRQQKEADTYGGPTGYLLAHVRRELTGTKKFTERDLDAGGLRIVTTIDKDSQDAAVAMMDDPAVFPTRNRPEGLRAALVSIDPATGGIVAMYGGPDYLERQQNAATQGIAQAGSTFKPFALVAGLENGISVKSTFNGQSGIKFKGTSRAIRNYGGASYGYMNLLDATAKSVNTVYVALNQKVGPAKTRDVAVRAGLPENTAGLNDYLGNVLGSASPHPIDMTTAYATFAAQGERHETHIVASVTKASADKEIYTGNTTGTRVFEEDVMADTTYALRQVVLNGSGRPASGLGRPVAGKTGTSSDNMSAWFIGYTPQLATSVVLYNTDADGNPIPIGGFGGRSEVTGGSYPVRMWTSYMREALQGQKVESFPEARFIGKTSGRAPSKTSTGTSTSTKSATTEASPTESPSETPTREQTATPSIQPTTDGGTGSSTTGSTGGNTGNPGGNPGGSSTGGGGGTDGGSQPTPGG